VHGDADSPITVDRTYGEVADPHSGSSRQAEETSTGFFWRPSLSKAIVGIPMIGLAPSGFVILYGARNNDSGLSLVALLAYLVLAATLCVLIARTRVVVRGGTLTVCRFRTRRADVGSLSVLVVVPITYPGLRTTAGVLTAIAFDAAGSVPIRVPMRGWTSDQVAGFVAACNPRRVIRIRETLTPKEAIERWPSSYPARSQWMGYVALAMTLLALGAVGALATWAVLSVPPTP
jgi:hypothetical protein